LPIIMVTYGDAYWLVNIKNETETNGGERMKHKGLVWVSSLASIFLFLPSLAIKLWEFITGASWHQKRWLVYSLVVMLLIQIIKIRLRFRKRTSGLDSHDSLVFLAKQRLVKGELSIEEFRQIREELKQG
jgi:uncharacterized membrane protein